MQPMQLRRPSGRQVWDVMGLAGCHPYIKDYILADTTVTGMAQLKLIWGHLRQEPMVKIFHEGRLHGLHTDVGKRRTDFRSYKGMICPGSLQIVLCLDSGRFYADIDKWNPYQDAINWFGHTFGEVLIPMVTGVHALATPDDYTGAPTREELEAA